MRHQKSGRKLGRNSAHRNAMFRNMTTSLLIHDRIRTTDAKAKELRKYVERMITLARKARKVVGEAEGIAPKALHLRRQALQYLRLPGIDSSRPEERSDRKELLDKLFVSLADRFSDRPGGYTRILKIGTRRGDGAPMSLIEFVAEEMSAGAAAPKKKAKKKKKPVAKAAAQKPAAQEIEEPVEETEETAADDTQGASPEDETVAGVETEAPAEPEPEPEPEQPAAQDAGESVPEEKKGEK